MECANDSTELRRLLLLLTATLGVEFVAMPGIMFGTLARSAEWSVSLQLLVLCLPRFAVMLALVLMFGPFRRRLWFSGFLAAYVAVLVASFYEVEVFVEWSSALAASRATLPYITGVLAAVWALWLRRESDIKAITKELSAVAAPDRSRTASSRRSVP
jgi:hypothetical protein